ncbi:HupE/UreJ family protein [Oceanobacter mangrovi]|uniref:HupE/UreJ family protein n=1 Tax=Oceanobacter mangrovi TaxID=2862510 RepID=UPI001C8E9430|nr:HupE/UreJ family protein [Oceanobacter mangrovi]
MPLHQIALWVMLFFLLAGLAGIASAHGVANADATFLESVRGVAAGPFVYLGAKHMVTGYDHLLFLAGVVFYLYRLKDVAVYVSLFALGHSITLLSGVLAGWHISAWLVDAVIGFSVVYKALDNMDIAGFSAVWRRYTPDSRLAVLLFGLVHGLGLATKLQDFQLAPDGLIANMLFFNLGVELGQLLALALILFVLNLLRRLGCFTALALQLNLALLVAGLLLMGYQLTGYLLVG